MTPSRRLFLKQAGLLSVASALPLSGLDFLFKDKPKFKMSLNPGAIGVSMPLESLVNIAHQYGFRAIAPHVEQFRKMAPEKRKKFLKKLELLGMSWDAAGSPLDFRQSEAEFRKGIGQLVYDAVTLQTMGVTRMSTWIMPTHKSMPYKDNFDLHATRLQEVAERLLPYDINLGLEYVGPKTLMERDKYPFIHTMSELKELIAAIDVPNVGIQLDAFHWYCAGETIEDIKSLKPEQIVTVDLNDAKAGRTRDEQLDWERELPGKSGVIDIQGFLKALKTIGYDGPIRAEPFNKELGEMEDIPAIVETSSWMKRSFILATD